MHTLSPSLTVILLKPTVFKEYDIMSGMDTYLLNTLTLITAGSIRRHLSLNIPLKFNSAYVTAWPQIVQL